MCAAWKQVGGFLPLDPCLLCGGFMEKFEAIFEPMGFNPASLAECGSQEWLEIGETSQPYAGEVRQVEGGHRWHGEVRWIATYLPQLTMAL